MRITHNLCYVGGASIYSCFLHSKTIDVELIIHLHMYMILPIWGGQKPGGRRKRRVCVGGSKGRLQRGWWLRIERCMALVMGGAALAWPAENKKREKTQKLTD